MSACAQSRGGHARLATDALQWPSAPIRGRSMGCVAYLATIFAVLMSAHAAAASTIYKCVKPDGRIVFSDSPCGVKAKVVQLGRSSVDAALPANASHTSAPLAAAPSAAPATATPSAAPVAQPKAGAYECTTPDGIIFYRHSHCPKSIAVTHYGRVVTHPSRDIL